MNDWREFHGPNAGYVLELYERYQQDPNALDADTRRYFEKWAPPTDGHIRAEAGISLDQLGKIVGAVNLAQAIREFGFRAARLDPLGSTPPGDPALELESHGLVAADLQQLPVDIVGGPVKAVASNAAEAIERLRAIYTSRTGFDFGHVHKPEERRWLREAVETGRFRPPHQPLDQRRLLRRLTEVEVFENFLHRIFPGKTRFSIEGLDMLVPMLDEMLGDAAASGTCVIILGMAHRGRLNVLAHILHKPYEHILAEFKDPGGNFTSRDELGWTGDVKYHKGKARQVRRQEMDGDGEEDPEHVELVVALAPNPSHLEHVNPVVLGMARAADSVTDEPGPPRFFHNATLPILIHGDASFPGQGIVAETLNMARLPGYTVGGTIHIIANNQLGFTTTPEKGRSTLHASDLAKGFEIPILHVNADDIEACIEVARLACAYRSRFEKDVLINLVGYRRYGHNEGDEPRFTQPLMYQTIENHPTVRQKLADALASVGDLEAATADELVRNQMGILEQALEAADALQPGEDFLEPELELPPPGAAKKADTQVSADRLRELNQALLTLPESFTPNAKLERAMKRRRQALESMDEPNIEWATAEELALASILADGVPVRLVGEDVERGTFSHRHAVFHDYESGTIHVPLQTLPHAKAACEIHNSPLTEAAAVGFEYGYNVARPQRLVIWEAQYGDFVNGAQAMIDEFVVSGRAKWEQTPSLVMLLPHGYEGQGPDHSSARPERFLQLAAETNLRLAYPTNAAQYFHLLRRQAQLLEKDPLPLIVLTPKSLLRHPRAASTLRDLAEGGWQPVIDDPQADHDQTKRLVLCAGKIFVDLVESDHRDDSPTVAIARIEQLYRFPMESLSQLLDHYPNLDEVVWVQEEPQNMGGWTFVHPRLQALLDGRWPLSYIGRPRRASPAEGSAAWHRVNQQAIIERAFSIQDE
ncbi:MAG: 2-oxoglutarate dehydrogenase E1 component [Candidatus Promineifilaceae bacterium]|nr:2-oxoglutarate dehydrogenase E1 component [Candidatus Promineifilaceae bacterium]